MTRTEQLTPKQVEALKEAFAEMSRQVSIAWKSLREALVPVAEAVHEASGHAWVEDRPTGHVVSYLRCEGCRKWHPDAHESLDRATSGKWVEAT